MNLKLILAGFAASAMLCMNLAMANGSANIKDLTLVNEQGAVETVAAEYHYYHHHHHHHHHHHWHRNVNVAKNTQVPTPNVNLD
jgi:hypothetical protein